METDTTTEAQVPTYTAVIVIGSIALLVMLELIFRGSE
jgi:hypothetical protein